MHLNLRSTTPSIDFSELEKIEDHSTRLLKTQQLIRQNKEAHKLMFFKSSKKSAVSKKLAIATKFGSMVIVSVN